MDHLHFELVETDIAREDGPETRLERIAQIREAALEPLGLQCARIIPQHDLEDPPLLVGVDLRPDDFADNGFLLADLGFADRLDKTPVFVFAGEKIEQVLDRVEAFARKKLPHLGTHPFYELGLLGQFLDGRIERFSQVLLYPVRWTLVAGVQPLSQEGFHRFDANQTL